MLYIEMIIALTSHFRFRFFAQSYRICRSSRPDETRFHLQLAVVSSSSVIAKRFSNGRCYLGCFVCTNDSRRRMHYDIIIFMLQIMIIIIGYIFSTAAVTAMQSWKFRTRRVRHATGPQLRSVFDVNSE